MRTAQAHSLVRLGPQVPPLAAGGGQTMEMVFWGEGIDHVGTITEKEREYCHRR